MKKHLDTKKHKEAVLQKNLSLKRQQEAEAAGPTQDLSRFASPYPESRLMEPPPHNLFHGARPIDNNWLDEEGNEFVLPQAMMDDQNWSSRRAQDFQRDIDAARSHKAPADELWGPSLDNDDPSSESDESDTAECEMPGLTASNSSESNEFAPYASKTVGNPLFVSDNNT